jgi:glucose dehydrogenase
MAHRDIHFLPHDGAQPPPAAGRAKVPVLVGLFAFVGVLAMAAVAVMSRVQQAPIDTNGLMSASFAASPAGPVAGAEVPHAGEAEFNERFAQEKRNARTEDLPAQF